MAGQELKLKPEKHIINILKNTKDHHPNFALFLGAGASITSGIKSAGNMIKGWRDEHHELYGGAKTVEDHFKDYHWHGTSEEYSQLFEMLYDQPSQRREHIETCIGQAFPSWGYIYLVNLIKERVFNVVLTTNFDDLVNEACYQFSSDIRPMTCAHDSSVRSIRITSKRPKILKLHGDFLFDNIKNTVTELETLEINMREKLKQIACEFGLIIVGYAGNDRSVMDCLDALLKSDDNFPHGVYWCIRKGEKQAISQRLEALRRFPKVHLIEIDGFDEFFANLHSALELQSQPELSDPYGRLADKLNKLLTNTKIPSTNMHPVIGGDISRLGERLKEMSNAPEAASSACASEGKISTQTPQKKEYNHEMKVPIPYSFLSQLSENKGDEDAAINLMFAQLSRKCRPEQYLRTIHLIRKYKKTDCLKRYIELLRQNYNILVKYADALNGIALELIHLKEYDIAEEALNELLQQPDLTFQTEVMVRMNVIQIAKHKKVPLSESQEALLKELLKSPNKSIVLGALILSGEHSTAKSTLEEMIKHNEVDRAQFYDWPIFKLLQVDVNEENQVIAKENQVVVEENQVVVEESKA
jgi:tetratricopeptide (TPR) repeat protein